MRTTIMKTLDLEKLPPFAQEELLDFYEFLLKKYVPSEFDPHNPIEPKPLAESSLAHWINHPIGINDFEPLSREEANAR